MRAREWQLLLILNKWNKLSSKSVFVIWQLPSQQNIKPCYAQANVAQMDALDDMLIYASRAGVDVTGMDIPTSPADWAFILKLAIY